MAELDTRIPLTPLGFNGQRRDASDGLRKALTLKVLLDQQQLMPLQVQGAQMGLQRQQMEMSEMQRAQEEAQRAREFFAQNPNIDPANPETFRGLSAVSPRLYQDMAKGAYAIQKEGAQTRKYEADAGKAQWERQKGELEFISGSLGTVTDQASYVATLGRLASTLGPDKVATLPARYDPAFVNDLRRQAIGAAKLLDDERARMAQAETARHNRTTEATAQGNLGVAQGQLGVARDRLRFDQSTPRLTITDGPNGPLGVDPRTLQAFPVTMGGAPVQGKPTESNSAAAGYGRRMAESDQQLRQLETKISREGLALKQGAEGVPLVGGLAGSAANYALSSEQQQVDQAQRNFINAILRRESGAVIADSEFESAKRQYFVMPGDTPANIEQKRQARKAAIEGIKDASGPLRDRVAAPEPKAPELKAGQRQSSMPARPKFGEVRRGYRFIGSENDDPADSSFWEKAK